jgi:hypothetical protein
VGQKQRFSSSLRCADCGEEKAPSAFSKTQRHHLGAAMVWLGTAVPLYFPNAAAGDGVRCTACADAAATAGRCMGLGSEIVFGMCRISYAILRLPMISSLKPTHFTQNPIPKP